MANELFIPSMDSNGDIVLATSIADYRKVLVDNVYNDVPVLRIVNEGGRKRMIDGGISIVETLLSKKQNEGGFFADRDELNTTQPDNVMLGEFKWQNVYEPIQISRDEERQNSGSEHKLLDLAAIKLDQAEKAMKDRMGQALVTPVVGANNLIDLSGLVGTGTLGTVAGGTDLFWQSTVTTSGAFATQGLTDMQTLYYQLSSSSTQDNPTHILTTRSVFEKYEQTRLPLARLSDTGTANAGFTNLTFKGVPIIWDQYITSGTLYMMNVNYWNLVVDTATDFITTDFTSPVNQFVKVAYIVWRGNQTTNNRRRHGKLTSIT